jgi:hypothetical protein
MFDTHVKPKVFKALKKGGVSGLPKSWEKSIYNQAADASPRARGIGATRIPKMAK